MKTILHRCSLAATALVLAGTVACVPPPPPGAIIVERRPPPERIEMIGVAPGPGYVWIPGHWAWGAGAFAWIGGHWVVVERGYHTWEPGRWRHHGHTWYWVEGYWR